MADFDPDEFLAKLGGGAVPEPDQEDDDPPTFLEKGPKAKAKAEFDPDAFLAKVQPRETRPVANTGSYEDVQASLDPNQIHKPTFGEYVGESFKRAGQGAKAAAGAALDLAADDTSEHPVLERVAGLGTPAVKIASSLLRHPEKRRELERGVSDVVTLGQAQKLGEYLDPEFAATAEGDAEAAPGYRAAGQFAGMALPSPAKFAAGKAAGAIPGTGAGAAAARGLAAYETMAVPTAAATAPEGERLDAAIAAATDPAGLVLSGGLPAASAGINAGAEKLAQNPKIQAAKEVLAEKNKELAVGKLSSDVTAAHGYRARATDQRLVSEIKDELFEIAKENPDLRPALAARGNKGLAKLREHMTEVMEPRTKLWDEIERGDLANREAAAEASAPEEIPPPPRPKYRGREAVPEEIGSEKTVRLKVPNFLPDEPGQIPITAENVPVDLPETPSTSEKTIRMKIPNFKPEGAPVVAGDRGYVPVGDETVPPRGQKSPYHFSTEENNAKWSEEDPDLIVRARDKNGAEVGSTSLRYGDDGTMSSVDTFVDPAHRRLGVASGMYDAAQASVGRKIVAAPRAEQTNEGAAFSDAWHARRAGPQLPPPEGIVPQVEARRAPLGTAARARALQAGLDPRFVDPETGIPYPGAGTNGLPTSIPAVEARAARAFREKTPRGLPEGAPEKPVSPDDVLAEYPQEPRDAALPMSVVERAKAAKARMSRSLPEGAPGEVEVAPDQIISQKTPAKQERGILLRDIVDGFEKAAKDAEDPALGGGAFGKTRARFLRDQAQEMIRIYGKKTEPKFNPDKIVNDDGMTAAEMMKILERQPDAPGVKQAKEQIREMATEPGGVDLDRRVPALDFRREVTEAQKTHAGTMGQLNLAPHGKLDALDAINQTGHEILDRYIEGSGVAPEKIAQLKKMNREYFVLKRAESAIKSRAWKDDTHTPFHMPHTVRGAVESGNLLGMGALALTHHGLALPLAATYGLTKVAPKLASDLSWRLATKGFGTPSVPTPPPAAIARLVVAARSGASRPQLVAQAQRDGIDESVVDRLAGAP